jgi:hypothetical protein
MAMNISQESLSPPVAALLTHEPAKTVTTMMVDLRRRCVPDQMSRIDEPPTQVDIVARGCIPRIESAE